MVENTRATPGPGVVRSLSRPIALDVRADAGGRPAALSLSGRWAAVESVKDSWRIDDEWWRDRPISRMYYRCIVDGGIELTVYHDLASGGWHQQRG